MNLFSPADSTGTHSLYTTYQGYEIMFHISTMLPYMPSNPQQVSADEHPQPFTALDQQKCVQLNCCHKISSICIVISAICTR